VTSKVFRTLEGSAPILSKDDLGQDVSSEQDEVVASMVRSVYLCSSLLCCALVTVLPAMKDSVSWIMIGRFGKHWFSSRYIKENLSGDPRNRAFQSPCVISYRDETVTLA
jgi:hypothetical protein